VTRYSVPALLLVVAQPLDDLAKRNVLSDICDLDLDAFALFGVRNDDHEAAFDAGDAVTLVADILDIDGSCLSLLDWGLRVVTFDSRFGGRLGTLGIGCAIEYCDTIRLVLR
jgi:hypothetical protein